MIFGKVWRAFKAQLNKVANLFWTADPIAQMQYEYDLAVEQLKEGREGGEQSRAVGGGAGGQVPNGQPRVAGLQAKVKATLQAGNRQGAADLALQLQAAKKDLAENEAQLKLHEDAYSNNLTKIKHASH